MAPRPHQVPRTPSTPGPLPSFPAAAETRYTPARQHRRNASATSFGSTSTAVTLTEEKAEKPDLEVGGGSSSGTAVDYPIMTEQFWQWKLVLRTCISIVDVAGFVTLMCAAGNMRTHHGQDWLPSRSIFSASMTFAFSLVYNGIALLALSVPLRRRGVASPLHPLVNMAGDLAFWIVFVIIALLTFLAGSRSSSDESNGVYDRHAQQHVRQPLYYASGSLACIATALHFAMFVWACVEAAQRRRSSSSSSTPRCPSSSTSRFSYFGASAADDEAQQAAFAEERARQLVGEMVRTGRVRVVRRGSGPEGVEVEGGEGEGMEPLLAAVERGLLKAGVVKGPEGTVLVTHNEPPADKEEVEVRAAAEEEEETGKGDKLRWT